MAGHTLTFKPIIGPKDFKLPDKYVVEDNQYIYDDDNEYSPDVEILFNEITTHAPDTTFLARYYSYSSKAMCSYECTFVFNNIGYYEIASEQDLMYYYKDNLIIDDVEVHGMMAFLRNKIDSAVTELNKAHHALESFETENN